MKSRLRKVIDECCDGNASVFADAIAVSSGNVADWLSGRYSPRPQKQERICERFGISHVWLALGEGEMRAPLGQDTCALERRIGAVRYGFAGPRNRLFADALELGEAAGLFLSRSPHKGELDGPMLARIVDAVVAKTGVSRAWLLSGPGDALPLYTDAARASRFRRKVHALLGRPVSVTERNVMHRRKHIHKLLTRFSLLKGLPGSAPVAASLGIDESALEGMLATRDIKSLRELVLRNAPPTANREWLLTGKGDKWLSDPAPDGARVRWEKTIEHALGQILERLSGIESRLSNEAEIENLKRERLASPRLLPVLLLPLFILYPPPPPPLGADITPGQGR